MKKILLVGIIAMVAMATFVVGLQLSPTVKTKVVTETYKQHITYHAVVCPVVTRANGKVEVLPCTENCLMNLGKDHVAAFLGNTTGAAVTTKNVSHMAIGNNTLDYATTYTACDAYTSAANNMTSEYNDQDCNGCGLSRQTGQYYAYAGVNGAFNYSYQFTSLKANMVVNQTCLFNATWAEGNRTIFACNDFTSVTLQINDKINVTWGIWVS